MTTPDKQSARMGGLKDAAAQLNCSESTVRRRVHDGTIPHTRIGKVIRIDLDALPGRERPEPAQSGGLPAEAVASLVSELVLAAPVLTEADVSAVVGVLRQAWAADR